MTSYSDGSINSDLYHTQSLAISSYYFDCGKLTAHVCPMPGEQDICLHSVARRFCNEAQTGLTLLGYGQNSEGYLFCPDLSPCNVERQTVCSA